MHNRSCENEFYLHENENHLHMKGWALNLVSIQRPRGTRKWPIVRFPREGQHIFFPNWAIPENIHTQPRTASMFQPPLAFRNSKMCYPPMPSEFHNHEPPLPFRISVFLEVHFRLSNAYMDKRTWIYASSRLWSSGTRWQALLFSDKKNLPLVARLCKLLFRSEFGYKNKHH